MGDAMQAGCENTVNHEYVEPSALERLMKKRTALLDRLDEVNRAIRALETYPELNGMVDLIRKASR